MTSQKKYLDCFDTTKIYEFAINSGGGTFYDYCQVIFDPENDNYKTFSYYSWEGKFKPCQTTNNKYHYIIHFLRVDKDSSEVVFKGPIFTEGVRKGSWDPWILTKRMWDI